jgi:hypothetical protein
LDCAQLNGDRPAKPPDYVLRICAVAEIRNSCWQLLRMIFESDDVHINPAVSVRQFSRGSECGGDSFIFWARVIFVLAAALVRQRAWLAWALGYLPRPPFILPRFTSPPPNPSIAFVVGSATQAFFLTPQERSLLLRRLPNAPGCPHPSSTARSHR